MDANRMHGGLAAICMFLCVETAANAAIYFRARPETHIERGILCVWRFAGGTSFGPLESVSGLQSV